MRYQYPLSRTGASIVSFILLHFCLRLEFREVNKNKQHVTLREQPLKCERKNEAACMHRPKNTLSKFLLVYLLRLLVVVVVFAVVAQVYASYCILLVLGCFFFSLATVRNTPCSCYQLFSDLATVTGSNDWQDRRRSKKCLCHLQHVYSLFSYIDILIHIDILTTDIFIHSYHLEILIY